MISTVHAAVFAHNEARTLVRSVRRLLDSTGNDVRLRVHLLVNGCRDATPEVARGLAAECPDRVWVADLPVADKAAAWNTYVYDLAGRADAFVFQDGDCWPVGDAVRRMLDRLAHDPTLHAVGAAYDVGFNRRRLTALQRDRRWLYGNLYAVRGAHLDRLRAVGFRTPVGIVAEDSLVTHACKACFPDYRKFDDARIGLDPSIRFAFHPLRPWRPGDVRAHVQRMVRRRLMMEQLVRIGWREIDRVPPTLGAIHGDLRLKLLERKPWIGPLDRAVLAKISNPKSAAPAASAAPPASARAA
ncbi:MAG: glycosyltransferase [Planctomycetota bacterium]